MRCMSKEIGKVKMTKKTRGSEWEKHGRRKPYTSIGIGRLPCFRCGEKADQQWQICADNNLHRPVCVDCDIALNKLVLQFMGFENITELMKKYRERFYD